MLEYECLELGIVKISGIDGYLIDSFENNHHHPEIFLVDNSDDHLQLLLRLSNDYKNLKQK